MQDSEQESIEANSLLKYSPRDISTPISSRGAVLVAGREAQCARGGGGKQSGRGNQTHCLCRWEPIHFSAASPHSTSFAGTKHSLPLHDLTSTLWISEPRAKAGGEYAKQPTSPRQRGDVARGLSCRLNCEIACSSFKSEQCRSYRVCLQVVQKTTLHTICHNVCPQGTFQARHCQHRSRESQAPHRTGC